MISDEILDLVKLSAKSSKEYTDLVLNQAVSSLENSAIFKRNLDKLEALIQSLSSVDPGSTNPNLSELTKLVLTNQLDINQLKETINHHKELIDSNNQESKSGITSLFVLVQELKDAIQNIPSSSTSNPILKPDFEYYGPGTGLASGVLFKWNIYLNENGFLLEKFDGVTKETKQYTSSESRPRTSSESWILWNS